MKRCQNCAAELEDNARFCLACMTSQDEKEQIQPPTVRPRWPLALVCLALAAVLAVAFWPGKPQPKQPEIAEESELYQCTADGVQYTFRVATRQEAPDAIIQGNCYALVRVEGKPADGIYRVPGFVGEDTGKVVSTIAGGAFSGTNAAVIDLGYNVRYVWDNAFDEGALQALHLHEDVYIAPGAFSGCDESLVIHCPDWLENTQGERWSELALEYGFRWQETVF